LGKGMVHLNLGIPMETNFMNYHLLIIVEVVHIKPIIKMEIKMLNVHAKKVVGMVCLNVGLIKGQFILLTPERKI
jgi:hypothetical protein